MPGEWEDIYETETETKVGTETANCRAGIIVWAKMSDE